MTPTATEDQTSAEEQTPTPDPEPRWGVRNRDLPDQLVKAFTSAFKKAQNEERYLRRLEVLRNRMLAYYERGHQHIYESGDSFRLAIPGAPWSGPDGNEYEWGDFIDDYNIFHGFQWILTSVLTQSPTGISFQPIDPSKSEDNQAATTADGLRKHFDRMNDKPALSREAVRQMCLSGRFIRWVKTVENAAKYGKNADGSAKKERVCCVYSSMASKVPITAKSQTDFRYLILYDDLDILSAKDTYSWVRKRLKAGENCLDENNYEKFARLGVLQGARSEFQASESIAHLITEGNGWLRPACFSDDEFDVPIEFEYDANEDGSQPSVRDVIEAEFPEGAHAVFVGKTYAESWAESMDDCLYTGKPFDDDSQFAMAVMDGAVSSQDKFNDQMNWVAECFAFGAPREYVNASNTEFAALVDQKAQPWGLTQLKNVPQGLAAEDMVHRTPNPEIPTTMQPYIEFLMGALLQFILACPPSVWGETSTDNKTATGQQLATNQAKGRLGILWSQLQAADAALYYQVALAAANDPDTPEEITVPVKTGQSITIRVERLRKGHFMCKPDEDSGFPDSANQIRAVLTQVMTMMAQASPVDPTLLKDFLNTDNVAEIFRTFGLTNFKMPKTEAAERQMEEIEELLNGVPVMPTPEEIEAAQAQHEQQTELAGMKAANDMNAGLPAAPPPPPFDPQSLMRSSVPIKPWDFDEWHIQACDEYLNGDACRIELQIGRAQLVPSEIEGEPATEQTVPNVRGVMNVWLHRQEHAKALAMKNPQPAIVAPPVSIPKPGSPKPLTAGSTKTTPGGPQPITPGAPQPMAPAA